MPHKLKQPIFDLCSFAHWMDQNIIFQFEVKCVCEKICNMENTTQTCSKSTSEGVAYEISPYLKKFQYLQRHIICRSFIEKLENHKITNKKNYAKRLR